MSRLKSKEKLENQLKKLCLFLNRYKSIFNFLGILLRLIDFIL